MAHIVVEKKNDVHIRVLSDMDVEYELREFFTFEFPGAKFTPKYRARLWDGKVYLYDQIRKTLYAGLLQYVIDFASQRGYTIEIDPQLTEVDPIDEDVVEQFAKHLQPCSKGEAIEVRDYQINAVATGLSKRRSLLVSPTGSGKSLIIYMISRWHIMNNKRIIVVVPTTSLVEQMYSDFEDYSTINQWSVEGHCQRLYSGLPKQFDKDVLFTTWQSVYTQPAEWFAQFDVIIGDEAHQYKAKSLTSIMEKMFHVKHRIGTTGSLDDKKINRLVLEGVFGKIHQVTTTKQLQDNGQLAGLKIIALVVKHPEDVRKSVAPKVVDGKRETLSYPKEMELVVSSQKRNTFIRNLAISREGNTLVLFQFVERHGQPLYDEIKQHAKNRPVYFIHGDVGVDERERIRKALSKETNAIVVASFGTTSTGINIPSIESIVFASPSKSIIRTLQSIGRGLRLNKGKTHCTLFDIADDLHWKNWKNYGIEHGAERYKIYAQEQFAIKLVEVDL